MKRFTLSLIFAAVTLLAADSKTPPQPPAVRIDGPRTVTVGERSVVPINICKLQVTTLVLPQGELTRNTQVADTENWVLQTTESKQASRYLSIKVKAPQTKETTLTVITDHDTSYTFILNLNSDACDSKVFIDADTALAKHIADTRPWVSPEEADRLKAQVDEAKKSVATAQASVQAKVDEFRSTYPAKLHFDYKYDAKLAEKMGIHSIYTDGTFFFVSATPTETPALYEIKDGKPSLIAFEFKDGLYSTARVIDQGYLAVGGNGNGKHQEKLSFRREVEAN